MWKLVILFFNVNLIISSFLRIMELLINHGSDKPWQGTLLKPDDVRKEYTETELNAFNSGVPTEYYE